MPSPARRGSPLSRDRRNHADQYFQRPRVPGQSHYAAAESHSMSSTLTPHPDREILLRLLDEDLSLTERQKVDTHLEACRSCQRDMEEVREALNDYQQFHQIV